MDVSWKPSNQLGMYTCFFAMLTNILQFHHRRNRNHGCGSILLVDGL